MYNIIAFIGEKKVSCLGCLAHCLLFLVRILIVKFVVFHSLSKKPGFWADLVVNRIIVNTTLSYSFESLALDIL